MVVHIEFDLSLTEERGINLLCTSEMVLKDAIIKALEIEPELFYINNFMIEEVE